MLNTLYEDHLRIQRQRTDDALAACGFEALAIYAGASHLQFLDDQPYPFKANPHFKLWAPLVDAADCWMIYQPTKPLKLVFLQPVDYWYKPPETPTDFWTSHFEITVIREADQARAHTAHLPRCAFIGEWRDEFGEWGFVERNPAALLDHLHYSRAIKTGYELECMRRASARAANGHHAAEAAFRTGASEYEIHLAYLRATAHTDNDLPYPSIVALNRNAAVLHYQHLDRRAPAAADRCSFLIDAGADFSGYACDITRTYSYADDEFAALIEGMHRLQQALCAQVRSGVDYVAIHVDAHVRIANLLRESNLITAAATDAVASGLSSVFFPHGVGHLLGLQVHDVAGFMVSPDGAQKGRQGHPHLRLTRTLEPGFVVTIEPGVYFIDALLDGARRSAHAEHINWNQVERFRPWGGVRIEDDVVCTADEPENLTRLAFAARA
ncbi:MAG: Xaa-Pro dipeptidase [Steroidobacter sp.]